MAQAVSYGSITIVDTNDIESITIEYARNQSTSNPPAQDSSDWSTTRPAWAQGYYIWQRARIHKSGTETSADTFGAAVCLTGSTGQSGTPGQSLTATKTQYTNAASNVTITKNNHTSYTWTDSTPEYDATKPAYWGRITNTYTNPAKTEYLFYKDQALTDAIYNAYVANSIATHAQEDAEGALSQANSNINEVVRLWQAKSVHSTPNPPSIEVTTGSASTYNNWSTVKPTATDTYRYFYYCDQSKTGGGICTWSEVVEDTSYLSTYEINALNVRTKNFFKGKDATYDGWFASGRTEDEGLKDNDAETYLYNARFAATNIALGYNKTPVINLDGSNGTINIYRLPTIDANTKKVTKAGALGMQLSASSLNFYEPPVGNADPTIAATLSSTGLNIADGSIILGGHGATGINNGDIALSNSDFKRSINGTPREHLRFAVGKNFGVKNDGTLYASNTDISGKISATEGEIGGWSIGTDTNKSLYYSNLTPGASTSNLVLSPSSTKNTNAIGGSAANLTWFISAGQAFGVTTTGKLYATGAEITGKINADTGRIGGSSGWTIVSQQISSGSIGSDNSMYLSTKNLAGTVAGKTLTTTAPSWRLTVGSNFGVDNTGKLYATGAEINGKITVSAGSNVYTTDSVNPLEVGGRNLILYSGSNEGYINNNANSWDGQTLLDTWNEEGYLTRTRSAGDASMFAFSRYISDGGKLEKGSYVVSATIRSSAPAITLQVYRYDSSLESIAYKTVIGEGGNATWTKYSLHFTTDADYENVFCRVVWGGQAGTVDFKEWKLEKGNKATAWTPAPEDIEWNAINGVRPELDALDDSINGEGGVQEMIEKLTSSIVIDPDEPSITLQTTGGDNSSEMKLTEKRMSLLKNGTEVLYLDSEEDDGAVDASAIKVHNSIKIGELEIFDRDGGIAIRG